MDGRLCQLDVLAAWDTRTWERTPPGAETGHAPPLPRASGSRAPPSSGSSPPRGFLPWEPQASREESCPCGLHRVGGGRQQQGGRADQLLLPSTENGRAGGEHARNSTPARISPPQAGDPSAPWGPDWSVKTPRRPFLMSRWGKQGTQWCASKASRTRKRALPSRFLPPTSFPPPLLCQPLAGLRLGSRSQPACPPPSNRGSQVPPGTWRKHTRASVSRGSCTQLYRRSR